MSHGAHSATHNFFADAHGFLQCTSCHGRELRVSAGCSQLDTARLLESWKTHFVAAPWDPEMKASTILPALFNINHHLLVSIATKEGSQHRLGSCCLTCSRAWHCQSAALELDSLWNSESLPTQVFQPSAGVVEKLSGAHAFPCVQ